MKNLHASTQIDRPIDQTFDYATSFTKMSEYVQNLGEIEDIKPKEPGVGQQAKWRFTYFGKDIHGALEITEYKKSKLARFRSTGDIMGEIIMSFEMIRGKTAIEVDLIVDEVSDDVRQRISSPAKFRVLLRGINLTMSNLKLMIESEIKTND